MFPEEEEVKERLRLETELNRLKMACGKLGEYFDTVQIFCTKQSEDNKSTDKYEYGQGNGYAIYGQVKEFIITTEKRFELGLMEDLESEEDEDVDKM